jgi:hypothetical protein
LEGNDVGEASEKELFTDIVFTPVQIERTSAPPDYQQNAKSKSNSEIDCGTPPPKAK